MIQQFKFYNISWYQEYFHWNYCVWRVVWPLHWVKKIISSSWLSTCISYNLVLFFIWTQSSFKLFLGNRLLIYLLVLSYEHDWISCNSSWYLVSYHLTYYVMYYKKDKHVLSIQILGAFWLNFISWPIFSILCIATILLI